MEPTGQKFKFNILNPKLIFAVLGVVILVEIIFAIKTLRQPLPIAPKPPQPISDGTIVLVSGKTDYKVGETVPVAVRVSTGGNSTDGIDLILRYDPKILETSSESITKGTIYQEFPVASVDSGGVIRISGVTALNQKGFNGIGIFASIDFKAKVSGKTTVRVDFKKGNTADSNIVKSKTSKDILGKVYNLSLTIK